MAGGSLFGSYSKVVGGAYVFNLIVGMGALALPLNFERTGLILGALMLLLLAFLAYMTVTFVVEAMANANALQRHRDLSTPLLKAGEASSDHHNSLSSPLSSSFDLTTKFEMVKMAVMFLGNRGKYLFYGILIVYLFGDLAIYAVASPLSLVRVTGAISGWTELNTYRLFLFLFTCLVLPFTFFDMQSSKFLQMATLAIRNVAFFTMIILAIIRIGEHKGASASDIPYFDIAGFPKLFGVAVYSFMMHHSAPALLHPIREKRGIFGMFTAVYTSVYMSYILLCFTAVFAFASETNSKCGNTPGEACKLQPLYTLNFSSYNNQGIADFLALFPCFTLTANFPLICITLRNNISELIFPGDAEKQRKWRPLIALGCAIPPILIAFGTQAVGLLVNITGSFAGVGIQYVLPALFVLYSRKQVRATEGLQDEKNVFASPFSRDWYPYFILVWSALTIIMAIYNLAASIADGSFSS